MFASDSRLPLVAALALTAAMVTTLLWQGYVLWPSPGDAPVGPESARQPEKLTPLAAADIDVAAIDLFGRDHGGEQASDVDTGNLPETNLRLTLRGVLAAEGDFPGSALIEDNNSHTEAYLVGSTLPGSAVLKAVRPDRVILERNGSLENLRFPEDEKTSDFLMAENAGLESSETGQTTGENGTDLRQQQVRDRLDRLRERLRSSDD